MNQTAHSQQPIAVDPALQDILDLMTMHSRGRQTRNLAIWLAPPRMRSGR